MNINISISIMPITERVYELHFHKKPMKPKRRTLAIYEHPSCSYDCEHAHIEQYYVVYGGIIYHKKHDCMHCNHGVMIDLRGTMRVCGCITGL